jgi:hypothetical protein
MSLDNQQYLRNNWLPAVLLRHDLPDGSRHQDLMVAQAGSDLLWTVRVAQDVDIQSSTPFFGVALPPHRMAYLTYEGPVRGGDLGFVKRLLVGEGIIVHGGSAGQPMHLSLRWQGHAVLQFVGSVVGEIISFVPVEP